MNLQRKLEEIRRKPEHIKLHYTYAAVAISMFFILLLWFFSLSDSIKKTTVPKQNVFDGLDKQKKSLKDATDNVKKSLDDLNTNLNSPTPDNSQTTTDSPETLPEPIQKPANTIPESSIPANIPPSKDQIQPPLNNPRPLPDVIKP